MHDQRKADTSRESRSWNSQEGWHFPQRQGGHPPLIMLDQRHPYPPAEDGGRGFPKGPAAILMSEGEDVRAS